MLYQRIILEGDCRVEEEIIMFLDVISTLDYCRVCGDFQYFYNSGDFHELNKNKVDRVEYFLFRGKRKKMALAVGIIQDMMKIPYSAPFGIFERLYKEIKLEEIDEAIDLLVEYAKSKKIKGIIFKLPPLFYDESFISKISNCLIRKEFQIEACDLNYQLYIRDLNWYESSLSHNAKKNLKRAQNECFDLIHCDNLNEKREAYRIIELNRKVKGYPLRMTFEQVMDTIDLVEHDIFLLKLGMVSVASAIIFKVNSLCYQVIYWGDIEGYQDKRPMNMLAYNLYKYYCERGGQILDIGPSTEDGMPNYGLCSYKESIGCDVSPKYTFSKLIL